MSLGFPFDSMGVTIVGEAPSRSSDPERPFCGWSGRWLAKQAGLEGYEELARRARLVNVLRRWPGVGNAGEKGSRFPIRRARREAKKIELRGVVLLAGRRVAAAFDPELAKAPYFRWHRIDKHGPCLIAVIPHPSGCNRWWNYEENREIARAFFRGLFSPIRKVA